MVTPQRHRPTFHGTGGTLFGIYIVNLLLTFVTLGFYSFWGRTRIRQYLWSQTEFAGDRFAYHGTGGELFLGYLKAMGVILLVYLVALLAVPLALRPLLGEQGAAVARTFTLLAAFAVLIPVALVGARRYRMSRTSWRGIRFSFRGRPGPFIKLYLVGALLTALTLTLYSPFFRNEMRRFFTDGAHFGTVPFAFDGRGADLFRPYLLALLLTIPTLGLCWFWYVALRERYYWEHTTFSGARCSSTMTGGGLLGLTALNLLLLVVSLGLAAPWVMVRYQRYRCDNVAIAGTLDLARVEQAAQAATGTGEGLAAALDVDAIDTGFGI
jgi:uncharacterized membrane protein YjgN (DUF898 family)